MKIFSQNYINFQKKLVANCKVGTGENSTQAKIYQLDYPEDLDYYKNNAEKNQNWQGSYYLTDASKILEYNGNKYSHYVMEDLDNDLLCLSVIDKRSLTYDELDYLETAPKLSSYNRDGRKLKYIGETMLAFLVKMARGKKTSFEVPNVAKREQTQKFYYDLCKFHSGDFDEAYLESQEFDDFIK